MVNTRDTKLSLCFMETGAMKDVDRNIYIQIYNSKYTIIQMRQILHYPNLKTVLMVETVLKEAELVISREELKKRLPTQIMHQTLNVVLEYLEERGLIIDGHKGILWTHNDNPKLQEAISRGTEL